eukprot:TRINITY_DN13392_c0_g1_i1.p1 TRINITY_DN13392_c0_g1~~TRINITY_DN13392_c0_g1_i1.p1  ORF type:complete len:415 (+),score=80.49 TRINITY_DN13392_c0_g1_i1:178-1245(+)
MTDGDREVLNGVWRSVGCEQQGPSAHPICATSPEQICVGACGGGQQDMTTWLPGAFGSGSVDVAQERVDQFGKQMVAHHKCASSCATQGIAVPANAPDAADRAVKMLQRCGVVQLLDAYDLAALDRFQKYFDQLKTKTKAYNKLLDTVQLHDGRSQVYLPFTAPFNTREAVGVSDLVGRVLEGYFRLGGHGYGIDHVSVLMSAKGSSNQSLHPDVPYFKGLSVSVHTALRDVTRKMGPTFFCPCTGEALVREEWPASAAIKMSILKRRECLASSFVPEFTKRGTVTIYDGAMFHKGLENESDEDRPVLKLEVAAEGFQEIRNYVQQASPAAKKQTKRFRDAFGPPLMGRTSEKAS